MSSRKEIACNRCGFPVRRGKLPFIWPSNETGTGRAAFCGVDCIEATAVGRLPEPMRTYHLEVEAGQ